MTTAHSHTYLTAAEIARIAAFVEEAVHNKPACTAAEIAAKEAQDREEEEAEYADDEAADDEAAE